MGICRDLKSEARIGPGSLPKSPEPLNLWGAAAPGASSITWARDQRRPGRGSRRCCPQAEARVLPPVPVRTCGGGTPAASSGPRACRRFLFSSGWVRARVGWGSRSREGGWGLLEAVWAPQALLAVTPKGLPSPPSLCVPQRPCSTATSTSGRRCTWATPSSTRTRSGCARSLLTSAADGAAPACPSATPLPEGRIPEAGGAGPGPSAVLFVLPASRPAAGAGAAHADGRDQQDAGVSWSAPASQPLVGIGCFCG